MEDAARVPSSPEPESNPCSVSRGVTGSPGVLNRLGYGRDLAEASRAAGLSALRNENIRADNMILVPDGRAFLLLHS